MFVYCYINKNNLCIKQNKHCISFPKCFLICFFRNFRHRFRNIFILSFWSFTVFIPFVSFTIVEVLLSPKHFKRQGMFPPPQIHMFWYWFSLRVRNLQFSTFLHEYSFFKKINHWCYKYYLLLFNIFVPHNRIIIYLQVKIVWSIIHWVWNFWNITAQCTTVMVLFYKQNWFLGDIIFLISHLFFVCKQCILSFQIYG